MARTVHVENAQAARDPDEPNVFIQWKGTDVCFDFWCQCGARGHYDGYFAYRFVCPDCRQVFEMPNTIIPVAVERESKWHQPVELSVS